MREFSLHILDLIENSIRAGASSIIVTIEEDHQKDLLKIIVEDNGSGLQVPPEDATDPFYTTKQGKRTGLGLSLFKAAAEQAGGGMRLLKSATGGLRVEVTMRLFHIDRSPMGDLAATFSSVVCTNPNIDLHCNFRVGDKECSIRTKEVAKEMNVGEFRGLAVARLVSEKIKSAITSLEVIA
jgi:hypothetical protein